MSQRRVFLSCVSKEFKDLRQALSLYLGRAGCDVIFQEEFSQSPHNTLDKLDEYIKSCQAVLHFIGAMPGAPADARAVEDFLRNTPDFLSREPGLRMALGDCSGMSYTQWEAFMARHHQVPLFVFGLDGVQLEDSQERHRLRLQGVGRYLNPFKNREDLFGQLIGDLRDIVPHLRPWKPFNLPGAPLGQLFKGREEDVRKIHDTLTGGKTQAMAVTTPRAIHGLGGVGKTRLAMEYGHRFAAEYTAVLFVKADAPETLRQNLAGLADPSVLDLPEYQSTDEDARVRAVQRWLQQHPSWLLIVDNVDSAPAKQAVEAQLASWQGGHVLITSRLDTWSSQVKAMALDVLDRKSAMEFLQERTEGFRQPHPEEAAALESLATELDGLALALEQAGAFIAARRISIPAYLDRWQKEKEKALAWYDGQRMQYPLSVAATWQTSFDQLSPRARGLLEVLAYFSPAPIPRFLFPEQEEILVELMDYSLARPQTEPPDTVLVHRLVQNVVRGRVERNGRGGLRWEEVVGVLIKGSPRNGNDPYTWKSWELLAEHVRLLLKRENSGLADPLALTRLGHDFAQFLQYRSGAYQDAEPLYRRDLEACERILGPEHPNTLTCVNNLASLLDSNGDYDQAEPLYRRALEARERILGPEHPNTLTSANNLAYLLYTMGSYDQAEPLFRRALEAWERILGPEHPNTLTIVNNLAGLLVSKGDYDQAEPLHRRAVETGERILGPEHPDTLTKVNNLAYLLYNKGNYDQAERLSRRALEARERILGPEHPDTLGSVNNLATVLDSKGDYEQAEPLYRRALKGLESKLGKHHPIVKITRENLEFLRQKANLRTKLPQ